MSRICWWLVPLQLSSVVPAAAQYILLSEIDYDQPGIDTAEWIEIQNLDPFPVDLTGLELVLRNGRLDGLCPVYCRVDLDEIVLDPRGRVVIGRHPCAVAALCRRTNAMQNGPVDYVAIVEKGSDFVVDSLEYEAGSFSICRGPGTGEGDAGEGSLQRCGGRWVSTSTSTPCGINECAVATRPRQWGSLKARFGADGR